MEEFQQKYFAWRKMLQKANSTQIKILRNLEQDGSTRAAELLGEKPIYENANRCEECPGCLVMKLEKACGKCQGCDARSGCNEYTRLCFSWERAARNFYTGSIVTSLSSHQDTMHADLESYRQVVGKIKDAAITLDMAVDKPSPRTPSPIESQIQARNAGQGCHK